MPSFEALPAEILLLIHANLVDISTSLALAAVSRATYSLWREYSRDLTYNILRKDAFAWEAALQLADLQQGLEAERGEPLPEDYRLRPSFAPRCLTPHQRQIMANREYADSACLVFIDEWSHQMHKGPINIGRLRPQLWPHEKEHFYKAFYRTVAYVLDNYTKAHTWGLHPALVNPDLKRLDLSLLDLWKLVEMAEFLKTPRIFRFVHHENALERAQPQTTLRQRPLDSVPLPWEAAFQTVRHLYHDRRVAAGFNRSYPFFKGGVNDMFITIFDDKFLQQMVLYTHPHDEKDLCFQLEVCNDP